MAPRVGHEGVRHRLGDRLGVVGVLGDFGNHRGQVVGCLVQMGLDEGAQAEDAGMAGSQGRLTLFRVDNNLSTSWATRERPT